MGKNRLFVPQETLDEWIETGRADVEGNEMTLADDGKVYHLAAAVLFLREATGAEDPHDLVGRVKDETQLTILGAEPYMDSVLLEDNAYDVRRGFTALPSLDPSIAPSRRVSQPPLGLEPERSKASDAPPQAEPDIEDFPRAEDAPQPRRTEDPALAKTMLVTPDDDRGGDDREDDVLAKLLLKSIK